MKMKYKINKEFFPFTIFTPPINEKFLSLAAKFMKVPKFIYKNKELNVTKHLIKSFDDKEIECFLFSPKNEDKNMPCLIYIHGGGFVLNAANYHYKNAIKYALKVNCKVLFVNYRLAPLNPHPIFFEDCYFATKWLFDNCSLLNINKEKIGIAGDSAGATLAVGVTMMAKDRNHPINFVLNMLIYPFLDARSISESCKKYVDTPMWNSSLSHKITKMTKPDKSNSNYKYYSPLETNDFSYFPVTYIETAEYDCLHDDGTSFYHKLLIQNVKAYLNETKGTMHGFDIKQNAKITKEAIDKRIEFLKNNLK